LTSGPVSYYLRAAAVPVSQRGTETSLLVEDHDVVREILTEILSGLGYRVLGTASGEGALAVAARTPGEIALLLTDVKMPGMNGRDLARRLRRKCARSSTLPRDSDVDTWIAGSRRPKKV